MSNDRQYDDRDHDRARTARLGATHADAAYQQPPAQTPGGLSQETIEQIFGKGERWEDVPQHGVAWPGARRSRAQIPTGMTIADLMRNPLAEPGPLLLPSERAALVQQKPADGAGAPTVGPSKGDLSPELVDQFPDVPPAVDLRARVVGRSIERGMVKLLIAAGGAQGVKWGAEAMLEGLPYRIQIEHVEGNRSVGYVAATLDIVKDRAVVINPSAAPGSSTAGKRSKSVQQRASGEAARESVHDAAARGIASPATALPFREQIQASFGPDHDLSAIRAHVGGDTAAAMGATAYATGDHVVFDRPPDLHTAAHEVAHTVQQRRGVQLTGGVGQAGDAYEQHADAVADRVVAGQSAADLLAAGGTTGSSAATVQRNESLNAESTESPGLRFETQAVVFGSCPVGDARAQLLKLSNHGKSSKRMLTPVVTSPAFSAYLPKLDIESGNHIYIWLSFKPVIEGEQAGLLSAVTTDGSAISIPLSGVGTVSRAYGPQPPWRQGSAGGFDLVDPQPRHGTGVPDAEPATRPVPSVLVPTPRQLDFGSDVKGDVATLVQLWNHGDAPVTIDDCYVVGGRDAFLAERVGADRRIRPGEAATVAVEYRPNAYTAEAATLTVQTSDGAILNVPLHGPPATELVSRVAGNLEAHPQPVTFDATPVGQSDARQIVLRNRGLDSIDLGSLSAMHSDSPFTVQFGPNKRVVPPGRTIAVWVTFAPRNSGAVSASLWALGPTGDAFYGFVDVRGEGVEARASKAADQESVPAPRVCEPLDADTEQKRRHAEDAIRSWISATGAAIHSNHARLRGEWIEYLALTTVDPTISPVTIPDSSIVRSLLSNAFGNALSDGAARPDTTVAPRAANVAQRLLKVADTPLNGRQVAKVAAAMGVGMSFIVGVLVETLAGVIFDMLFPDHSVEKAVQDAYDQGRADGSQLTGDKIKEKIAELDKAQLAAIAERDFEMNRLANRVEGSCDEAELAALTVEIADMTEHATQMTKCGPSPGAVSRGLLALWVRDHAASTTRGGGDALNKYWEKATATLAKHDGEHFEAGKLKNQPDLFVAQCLHEWGRRGMEAPEALQGRVYGEIGGDADQIANAQGAEALAEQCLARFDGREFVWGHGGVRWDILEATGLPRTSESRAGDTWEAVSCTVALSIENGSCVATRFNYRIKSGVNDIQAYTKPGETGWHILDERLTATSPPQHAVSVELYAYIAELKAAGVEVTRDADVANNPGLQAIFGKDITIPRTLHADGRPEPITVFRVRSDEISAKAAEMRHPLPGATLKVVGDTLMVQGGNTILVVDKWGAGPA